LCTVLDNWNGVVIINAHHLVLVEQVAYIYAS